MVFVILGRDNTFVVNTVVRDSLTYISGWYLSCGNFSIIAMYCYETKLETLSLSIPHCLQFYIIWEKLVFKVLPA